MDTQGGTKAFFQFFKKLTGNAGHFIENYILNSYIMDLFFRGFGFVTFSDSTGVDKVLEHGTHDLDGKKVIPGTLFRFLSIPGTLFIYAFLFQGPFLGSLLFQGP